MELGTVAAVDHRIDNSWDYYPMFRLQIVTALGIYAYFDTKSK